MKIGNSEVGDGAFLAPMAGYTDIGFRYLCRKYGASMTYTEMVSIKGLDYNNENTKDLLLIHDIEKPSAVQLFGTDIDAYLRVLSGDSLKIFDIIDINMGCPVRKIVSNGDGSALMKNIPLSKKIVKAVKSSGKAVSVKIRSGFDTVNAPEFAKALEDAGADAITVHARTRERFYSGEADWNVIKAVKSSVKIPVIGNGDVKCYGDIKRMKDYTGCDGVMIGRAALGNPYIFSDKTPSDLKGDIMTHINMMLQNISPQVVTNLMKKHLCFYGKFLKSTKSLRTEVNSAIGINELFNIVEKYF